LPDHDGSTDLIGHAPIKHPCMGAFSAFADPVGNEFGLYEEPPG